MPGARTLSSWPPPGRRTSSPSLRSVTTLGQHALLALAGAGATAELAATVGARLLTGDPVTEAEQAGWSR